MRSRAGGAAARRVWTAGVWSFATVAGVSPAQGAPTSHPFAPPVAQAGMGLSPAAGILDLNRDGSPDVVAPGIFLGLTTVQLDEHAHGLGASLQGPVLSANPAVPGLPQVIALAAGDFDGDGVDDLVAVSSVGMVHSFRNHGLMRIGQSSFAPDVVIDAFHAALPANPPFRTYSAPRVLVTDIDGDGHRDILVGVGIVDRWAGAAGPGLVVLARGDGLGNFTVQRHALAGSVIDLEWADLDGNGQPDHVVVLTEQGLGGGVYGNAIVHLLWNGTGLAEVGSPQTIGPGRATALEVADVIGDSNRDYVVAVVLPNVATIGSGVFCFAGDGQGNVSLGTSAQLVLPACPLPGSNFVSSLQTEDFDGDGHVDLAVLRGRVLTVSSAAGSSTHAASEVLYARGPLAAGASFDVIPLPGHHYYSSVHTSNFAMLPIVAQPDQINRIDLGRDGRLDLAVTSIWVAGSSAPTSMVLLRNTTAPAALSPRFEKVGEPSGGVVGRAARIGFDGAPRIGNGGFACTIQNVRGGCLVGLMWGDYAQANLLTVHGFDLHLAPTLFGYAAIASGSGFADGAYRYPLPIPNDPSLVGDAGWWQYNYYDHVVGLFGGTQATGLSIAP
jgi:hypothetical protein